MEGLGGLTKHHLGSLESALTGKGSEYGNTIQHNDE